MKKVLVSLIFILLASCSEKVKIENINIQMLSKQLENYNRDIYTIFKGGKTYYFNSIDSMLITPKGYDFGYPVIGKSAIIIEDKLIGVINRKGNYIIKPQLKKIQFSEDNRDLFFWNNFKDAFNLNQGELATNWTTCTSTVLDSKYYPFENDYFKVGLKADQRVLIKPKYEKLIYVNDNCIIAKKGNNVGIINSEEKIIEDFKYSDINIIDYPNPNKTFFSLKKDDKWSYFKNERKLFECKYKCESFNTKLEKSIGIFNVDNLKNILFENGKTLSQNYKSISENGLVAIKENKIFHLIDRENSVLLFEQ